ncbi:MAG: transcription termination factor, utilization substance protein, partial [Cyanobacteriota bacterium]
LSLAIGKEGQNVRLAARLTGWKIDIKDVAKFDEEAEMAKWTAQAEAAQASTASAEEELEYEDVDSEEAVAEAPLKEDTQLVEPETESTEEPVA